MDPIFGPWAIGFWVAQSDWGQILDSSNFKNFPFNQKIGSQNNLGKKPDPKPNLHLEKEVWLNSSM